MYPGWGEGGGYLQSWKSGAAGGGLNEEQCGACGGKITSAEAERKWWAFEEAWREEAVAEPLAHLFLFRNLLASSISRFHPQVCSIRHRVSPSRHY